MHLEEFIEALERGVAANNREGRSERLSLGFRFDFRRELLVWWFQGQGPDEVREFSATFFAVAKLNGGDDLDRLLVEMFEDEVRRLREVLSRLLKEKGIEKVRKEEESRGLGLL